jgi:hypothetical protein
VRGILLANLLIVSLTAHAEERTIPWYMAHPNILYPTIQVCHESARYEDTVDCRNAEAAVDGLWARAEGQRAGLAAILNDPSYWASHRIARDGEMVECARRWPGDAPWLPYCAAAARSYSLRR